MSLLGSDIGFKNWGVATAYVALPPGTLISEEKRIREGAIPPLEKHLLPHDRSAESMPANFEIACLLGQADLMLQLQLTNLRPVADLDYPSLESEARVFNWVFSVPYTYPDEAAFVLGTPGLRFVLHLRLRRGLFAFAPIERETRIVNHLAAVLKAQAIPAAIEAGLGWSDMIINGVVPWDRFEQFRRAVITIHETHYIDESERRYPVFERTLTVLGYVPGELPDISGLQPLILARTKPGQLYGAVDQLVNALAIDRDSLRIVDGKSDIVALPGAAGMPEDFLRRHRNLVSSTDHSRHLQRLETHIMVEQSDAQLVNIDPLMPKPEHRLATQCFCRLNKRPVYEPAREKVRLPNELEQSIQNVRFLFKAAMEDETNCCDVAPALRAGERGLSRLGKIVRQLNEKLHSGLSDSEARKIHASIGDAHKQIELWSLLAERILRQRTIGSFEEILGQTDRALSYRGGVQKFLYLADSLMNEFALLVRATLLRHNAFLDGGTSLPALPVFASLYDSVATIQSMRGTGLVRIPVKHLFKLPFVIPDLWHEVGAYFFFRAYPIDILLPNDDASLPDTQRRYLELADHYADLLVYLVGFRQNFTRFMTSLVRGSLEALSARAVPLAIRSEKYGNVLLRLYLVSEFEQWRSEPASIAAALDHGTVRAILDTLDEVVRGRFGGSDEKLPPHNNDLLDRVASAVLSRRFAVEQRRLTTDLLSCTAPPRRKSKRGELFAGQLMGFGSKTDLNAIYGTFYWEREYRRMRKLPFEHRFKAMAALGRSVTIECQKRQIT